MTVSEILKACAAYKDTFCEFSLDLYYNDIRDEYIAKINFPIFCERNKALKDKHLVNITVTHLGDTIESGSIYFTKDNIEEAAMEALMWLSDTEKKL